MMYATTTGLGLGMRAMTPEEINAKVAADYVRAMRGDGPYGRALANGIRPAPDVIGGPKRVPDVPPAKEA